MNFWEQGSRVTHLSGVRHFLAELEGGGSTVGQEVSLDVEDLRGIDQRCDLR